MGSPTSRTLDLGRKNGWLVDVVERWIGGGKFKVRRDLFGCIDLIALDGLPGVLGIQATSGSNGGSRVRKIQTECREAAERWLRAGNRLVVWGWSKQKNRWGYREWRIEPDRSGDRSKIVQEISGQSTNLVVGSGRARSTKTVTL